MVEVIVVAGLLGFAGSVALMALPRGREASRFVGCQRNLMQVGVGLQMYHQGARLYPTIPDLAGPAGDGPIKALLETLALPDLLQLDDPAKPPRPGQAPPKGVRVPGLACPSDPHAMDRLSAPVLSYRANTGDSPEGRGGPFQPGRAMTSAEVEAADGLAFTAAFAERLVGTGKDGDPSPANYAIGEGSPPGRWRGDAGSDWAEASWRSSLYSHAPPPNAPASSIAEDGRSARMGASSGHVGRVNLLMMDGSVRPITPSIDPKVWASLGTVADPKP